MSANYKDLSTKNEVEETILRPDITYKESQDLYSKWAEFGTYDDVLGEEHNIYRGQIMLAETMEKLFTDKTNVRLLDVGAGTGLTGDKLKNLGYKYIDAVEPLPKFAEDCSKKGCYTKVMNQPIGLDLPLDVPDNYYDAVCTVGAFGPGAIPPSAYPEFIRVTKPGGYILNVMREEYLWTVPQYRDKLQPFLKELEGKGLITQIEWLQYPGHYGDKSGVRILHRVC
ncbi:Williams-Beuren syndrome chromosomal region 27 protein [Elysia marginata]|uniref:Williams-Beuren syndrome chromosomal region 27 protein n=1 Tax=Elysia marginata TaxID=1093978 RepID=A0AAV4HGF7_9GAST|nr:Williams-Beuren syndrome chromosomal region 27 protein [Elysia marginata]